MPLEGAHRCSLGYFEVRPSEVVGQDILILDLREDTELGAGHIAGAQAFRGVRDEEVLRKILPSDFPMVVVCGYGPESKRFCLRLCDMGYREVHHLVGGMRRWRAEGHPVRTGLNFERFAVPLPVNIPVVEEQR